MTAPDTPLGCGAIIDKNKSDVIDCAALTNAVFDRPPLVRAGGHRDSWRRGGLSSADRADIAPMLG